MSTNVFIRGKDELVLKGLSNDWSAITSSSSGQYLAACAYGYYIYYSHDYGANWAKSIFNSDTFGNGEWTGITSSSSGQYMAACDQTGYIFISKDYGFTWEDNGSVSESWYGITSSSSGQYLAKCCFSGGGIYVSPDYGASWIQIAGTDGKNWTAITSSSSGQYLAACHNNNVSISNNYGNTWEEATIVGSSWTFITSSDSGQYLAVCASSVYIFISSDYGATWQQSASSPANMNWRDIKSSGSGQYLAACAYNDYIYTSSDYGASWTPIPNSADPWNCITYSSCGQYLAAGLGGGYLYTYKKTVDMGEIYGSMINELQVSQYSPHMDKIITFQKGQQFYDIKDGYSEYTDTFTTDMLPNGFYVVIIDYFGYGGGFTANVYYSFKDVSGNALAAPSSGGYVQTYLDTNYNPNVAFNYFVNITNGLKVIISGQSRPGTSVNIDVTYNFICLGRKIVERNP